LLPPPPTPTTLITARYELSITSLSSWLIPIGA
jgi:hypothetical protein